MDTTEFITPHSKANLLSGQHQKISVYSRHRDDYEELLIRDVLWLLDGHIRVVEPDEMFKFDDDSVDLQPKCEAFLNELSKLNQGTKEKDMYPFLQKAFDEAVPETLRCFDISSNRPTTAHDAGGHIKQCPDLILTFDENPPTPQEMFHHPAVFVEVKSSSAFDPTFLPTKNAAGLFQKMPTTNQQKLLLQILRYTAIAQYPMLPWNYVYLITISGPIARIWKFSSGGCEVTTRIHYQKTPLDLIQFLHVIGQGGRRAMGLGVGNGAIFQDYAPEPDEEELLEAVGHVYSVQSGNRGWDKPLRKLTGYWTMEIQSKDLFQSPDAADGTEKGDNEPARRLRLIVFRNPIHWTTALFSPGTRCYLAVDAEFINGNKASKGDNETLIRAMRVVKTAWQYNTRHHEADLFNLYQQRKKEGDIPCGVPTLLASGKGTTQPVINANYWPSEDEVDREETGEVEPYQGWNVLAADLDESLRRSVHEREVETAKDGTPASRDFHWLLFKEVGAKLENARSSKEFLRVLLDALEAHQSFYDAKILHRDISGNNIMIRLSTLPERRGLLIDWDMGKDMEEKESIQRPMRAGTLLYMSVALRSNPSHQLWHDIESFFWVWIFYTILHMEGVRLDGVLQRDGRIRANTLNSLFPSGDFSTLAAKKRLFFDEGVLITAGCPQYEDSFELVQRWFMQLYRLLGDIGSLRSRIERKNTLRGSSSRLEMGMDPYSATARDDLSSLLEFWKGLIQKDDNPLMSQLDKVKQSVNNADFPGHTQIISIISAAYNADEEAQWLPFDPPDKGHDLMARFQDVSQSEEKSQRTALNPSPMSLEQNATCILDQIPNQETQGSLHNDPKAGKRKAGGREETSAGMSSERKRPKRGLE